MNNAGHGFRHPRRPVGYDGRAGDCQGGGGDAKLSTEIISETVAFKFSLNDSFGMALMKSIPPDQMLALLADCLRSAPDFKHGTALTEDDLNWLSKSRALLDRSGSYTKVADFDRARIYLNSRLHNRNLVLEPLRDLFYEVELASPTSSRGAFIPAGETFKGYAAVVKILQDATQEIFVVDPYLDAQFVFGFLPHVPAGVAVRCLASKKQQYHPQLVATFGKFTTSTEATRISVEIRYSSQNDLHDRLIFIDKSAAWTVSQSLKDVAKKSAASLQRVDAEMLNLKSDNYDRIWAAGIELLGAQI